MIAVAAVDEHADKLRRGCAKLFLTGLADVALPAADPRKHETPVADLHAFDIRADAADDLADVLVPMVSGSLMPRSSKFIRLPAPIS